MTDPLDEAAFATPSPVIETEGSGLREAVERFIADYDDGDRADAGNYPLMEAHVADFRAALAERSTDREALLSRELIGEAAEAGYRQGYGDGVEDATPEGERPYVDGVGQSEGWMQWRDDVLPTLFPSKRSAVELAATSGQDDVIAVLAPAAILALRPVGAEQIAENANCPVGGEDDVKLAREMGHEGSALELAVIGKIEAMTADRINHWFSRSRGAVATPDTALAHQVYVALVALKAIAIVAVRRALPAVGAENVREPKS